jgi:hypothetical protein
MGWLEILGTLANAVVQSEQHSSNPLGVSAGAERRTRSLESVMTAEPSRVTVIPADPNEEIKLAEAETRRMLEEAYSEMIDERVDYSVRHMSERVDQASAKVIDLQSNVDGRLDAIGRDIDAIHGQTRDLALLQKKVNVLLGVTVALLGLCGYLLYLSLRV